MRYNYHYYLISWLKMMMAMMILQSTAVLYKSTQKHESPLISYDALSTEFMHLVSACASVKS